MSAVSEKLQSLLLDIDTRLIDLWAEFDGWFEWDDDTVSAFFRYAYAQGYTDALKEPSSERGKLLREYGFRVPERSKDGTQST